MIWAIFTTPLPQSFVWKQEYNHQQIELLQQSTHTALITHVSSAGYYPSSVCTLYVIVWPPYCPGNLSSYPVSLHTTYWLSPTVCNYIAPPQVMTSSSFTLSSMLLQSNCSFFGKSSPLCFFVSKHWFNSIFFILTNSCVSIKSYNLAGHKSCMKTSRN